MKRKYRSVHFILCTVILIAINTPTAHSNENCSQEGIAIEIREELNSQLAVNSLLETISLINGVLGNIDFLSTQLNSQNLSSDDLQAFSSSR